MADCLRCQRPVNWGMSMVSSPALGGMVHMECMTDEDAAKVWPEKMARALDYRDAEKFIRSPVHDERRCRSLCVKFNIACPVHDREDDASEEE